MHYVETCRFLYRINAGISAIFSHQKLLKGECSGDNIFGNFIMNFDSKEHTRENI